MTEVIQPRGRNQCRGVLVGAPRRGGAGRRARRHCRSERRLPSQVGRTPSARSVEIHQVNVAVAQQAGCRQFPCHEAQGRPAGHQRENIRRKGQRPCQGLQRGFSPQADYGRSSKALSAIHTAGGDTKRLRRRRAPSPACGQLDQCSQQMRPPSKPPSDHASTPASVPKITRHREFPRLAAQNGRHHYQTEIVHQQLPRPSPKLQRGFLAPQEGRVPHVRQQVPSAEHLPVLRPPGQRTGRSSHADRQGRRPLAKGLPRPVGLPRQHATRPPVRRRTRAGNR